MKPSDGSPSQPAFAIRTRFLDGDELLELSRDLAAGGTTLIYQGRPQGGSMRPFIRSGDRIVVERVGEPDLRVKDVIVFRNAQARLVAHRLLRMEDAPGGRRYVARGDALVSADPPCAYADIVGRVVRILRGNKEIAVDAWWLRRLVDLWLFCHPWPLRGWAALRRLASRFKSPRTRL